MVIRNVGKIRSFRISHRIVFIALGFLFLYILTSIYIFNKFFNFRTINRALENKVNILEADQKKNQKLLHDMGLYTASLEDHIRNIKEGETAPEGDSKEIPAPDTGQAADSPSDSSRADSGKSMPVRVEIRDIEIRQTQTDMNIDFKLANMLPEKDPAEGYIHIIAMDADNRCPGTWNSSRDELSDCLPVNYKKGRQFAIQRFKLYPNKFEINSDSEFPASVIILVYDQSGHMILKKVIDVSTENT